MTITRKVILLAVIMMLAVGVNSFAKSSRSSGDAWMGVYTQTVDHEMARAFNLKSERGVVINEVVEDSPADKAGLKEEDVIIGANGSKIETSDDLTDMVDDAKPGDKITLDVIRDGKEMQLAITLGDRSDSNERTFSWTSPTAPLAAMAPRNFAFNFNGHDNGSFIGVSMTDLTEQLGDYFGVKNGNGVLVSDVDRDSPAEKAGIKAGDVIVAIDGEKVADSRDVRDLVQDRKVGTTASIDVLRDHKPMTLKVQVEKRKSGNFFGYSYGSGKNSVVSIPRMRGLNFGSDDGDELDNTELRQQMEELRAKLADMKVELKNDKDLQEQLRELKEELKELKAKLH
ncbi:MAG: PDZ domain-containing protein [Candidatus Zixiibacteriota bacterium]